ncbi:MAG TPA: serine/threonine-protein kinase, partial [Solirubrobacteraceae bacterium]|nr:serine/threonine-protein kinase [Solirubrobacteraceae bacterium]
MAARPQSPLPVHSRLSERYELVKPMASGGMASVWCARDRLLDRPVAIKLMAEQLATDSAAVRRFEREARAAARLSDHPNVVTIYDVGQTPPGFDAPAGRPFIVMERLLGGTVADALRAAPVKAQRALNWLREAAAAIDFAHARGVIHRDIKPSNFLLDAGRALHVADFGIALVATEDTLTATGQLLGTAAYLAPEVALGRPATDASDRYALAVAAFELLTGERPFRARHFAAQTRQHIETPPPSPSQRNPALPPALDRVLAQGMAKRPEERFASADELVGAIADALVDRRPPPATPPATATARMPRPAVAPPRPGPSPGTPRRARAIALGALAALLLGVGIAAALAGGGKRAAGFQAGAGFAPPQHHSAPAKPATHAAAPAAAHAASTTTSAPPQSADALEARGHQLLQAGNYNGAIPVLQQAVAGAPHGSLTYAYALYDLGRSLRLAGDPRAAIPILEQRLQIPNQTGLV